MINSFCCPPPHEDITDICSWERFCKLVAQGAGVCDRPARGVSVPASESSQQDELRRVEHHRRNAIPFLMDDCGLAGKSILEFGAGTGGLAVAMIQAGARTVDAVEPVKANFDAGRWRARAYGCEERIRFHHVTNTAYLPFADHSFDAVVCSSVLQYVPDARDRRVFLTEMARVVRMRGLLIVCATGNGLYPGGPHSSRWWSNLMPGRATRLGHDRGITYWEVRRTLSPLGFSVVHSRTACLKRWHRRARASSPTGLRTFVQGSRTIAFGTAATLLGLLSGAPTEAFLPFPELAFRVGKGDAAVVTDPETFPFCERPNRTAASHRPLLA